MKTIIFDLDGTLADTSGDLIGAANACFQDLGHGTPLDPVKDAATGFRGGRAMLTLGLRRLGREPEARLIDEQFPRLLDHYERLIDATSYLYPGAIEAVQRLRSAGHRTGICTNKPEYLAVEFLKRFEIASHFDSLIGADTLPTRKPDPAPYLRSVANAGGDIAQSLLVGDTDTDRNTAIAAGVPCILVTFGPAGHRMAELKPEGLMAGYHELDDLVDRLLG